MQPPSEAPTEGDFRVALDVFQGPFDLLLQLIGRHELDITEISLSRVTDEFISFVAQLERAEELDRASEFIVVAATLLDMKLVSLLPQGDYVDAEDVAVLEARDLLFARLLQYRAFKEAAEWFRGNFEVEERRTARAVPLEQKFIDRVPDLVWTHSLDDFGAIAAIVFAPREIPTVGLDHLHAPLVSIREQASLLVGRLRDRGPATFRELVADADVAGVVVARFLAVLELFRRAAVELHQEVPLGELTVSWSGEDWNDEDLSTLGADYDQ
ncbi:segregation and condensation protein A [Gulosibacter sediminis]|uniref:segregation and condensation protein A n=1 Tax=Gulosibacter sediminis TaxID=1729695 RepID=UPI0024ACE438|nr:ScpA family protein [Gulosibacter sediminis]